MRVTDDHEGRNRTIPASASVAPESAGLPTWLLEMLVCPSDRTKVQLVGGALVCSSCHRSYPIRDGIPVMIADDESEHKF